MLKLGRTSLRLSLQFAFLYSILSAIILVGAYWFTNFEIRNWLRDQMTSDAIVLSEVFKEKGLDALVISVDVMSDVNFENSRIFQLSTGNGEILAGNIGYIDNGVTQGYVSADKVEIDGKHADEISGYWLTQSQIGEYSLIQGTGNHVIAEVLEALSFTLLVGFILIVGTGSVAGVWVGRLTERRIQLIYGTLEKISAGKLAARVPTIEGSHDDLTHISNSINETLAKLENLMESQVQISNDIAHDLRTPLQRLRQRLEKMLDQNADDQNDVVAALEQTEEIIGTFNALLRIAQIEAGNRREHFQQIDLNSLVTNVHEAYEPAAEDDGQKLLVNVGTLPVLVLGDPSLIMQLISNFVENALRHTPAGTLIEIIVSQGSGCAVLSISDDGPGIDAEDRDKVFRRFYRGEKSRTAGGNGLGMSLCKAIAGLHHASVDLSDNAPGLRVDVKFPIST